MVSIGNCGLGSGRRVVIFADVFLAVDCRPADGLALAVFFAGAFLVAGFFLCGWFFCRCLCGWFCLCHDNFSSAVYG
jgi:hypothetical protein